MSKEVHAFSIEVATKIGIERAIILQHLIFLQRYAPDGWVKKSNAAMALTYPYLTEKVIRGALDRMERDGFIISDIRNERPEDRTKSYYVTAAGHEIYETEPFDKRANGFDKRANDILPKGQMLYGNYSLLFSSSTQPLDFKEDYRIREAFTLSRKIPAEKFDAYLDAWFVEIKATGQEYNKPSEAIKHFLNFAGVKYQRETSGANNIGRGARAEPKPSYTAPANLKTA